jgi:hypothetical protein
MGAIHAARLDHSPRLQRLLSTFRANPGAWLTTLDLIALARICAVNSAVDELRANGFDIPSRRERRAGEPVWQGLRRALRGLDARRGRPRLRPLALLHLPL